MKILRSAALVPTFRSSGSIAAPTFTNFGKSRALANLLILVPLIGLKSLKGARRLRCRDFRSAVLVWRTPRHESEPGHWARGPRSGRCQPQGGINAVTPDG